jgi:drug/metabolite transporter (DMT)-like permease
MKKAIIIAGMLIFGTCTVVTQKLVFSMSAEGRDGDEHTFEKPWFQTEVMFLGMAGCLAVYEISMLIRKKQAQKESETMPLMGGTGSVQDEQGSNKLMQYVYVMAPAACDMVATASMNIGLLWIPASVWQMLRGSMVVFSAIFSKFFLHRELFLFHWVGVGTVVFALLVVAMSSIQQGGEDDSTDTTKEAIGIALVVAAQVIQASQIVIEEHLLKGISIDPILIVGLEGLWGGILSSVMLFIVYFIEPPVGEDTLDTFVMLGNSPGILLTIIFYAIVILCYNLFGMLVTNITTAVIRTILEALRTACVWFVNLFIYYVIDKEFGEAWTDWSYLQLCGFLFLLIGLFVYNGIFRIQGLYYPDEHVSDKEDDEVEV